MGEKFSSEFPLIVSDITQHLREESRINTNLSHPKIRSNYGVITYDEDQGRSSSSRERGRTDKKTKENTWGAKTDSPVNEDKDKVITE